MFDDNVLTEIAVEAKSQNIELATLLAVVEIESGGKALEPADGKTPTFLFERHIFYRQLKAIAPDKLQQAIDSGLAIPKWDKAHQYRDQNSSANRLALLARARAVHSEAANRSCSWGVGQTMGFLYADLGFKSATEMIGFMVRGGVSAQVDCMVREIKRRHLDRALAAHDWAAFAKGYNGAGYAQNAYDVKLARAYARWLPKAAEIAQRASGVSPKPSPAPIQPAPKPAPLPVPEPAQTPPGATIWSRFFKALVDLFGRSHNTTGNPS